MFLLVLEGMRAEEHFLTHCLGVSPSYLNNIL
jgi:hypothetical protein